MKLRLLLTALIAIPCLLSCNREEESIAYSIELDASYVSFDAGEDEKTVNIVCNSEWTLSTDEDDRWCRASAYKGRGDAEITFKAEPNMATEERSLTYVFQAGDKTEELLVIQDGHVYSISIDSTEFRLDAGGGERKVAVTSSDEWTLEVQEEWCVPSVTSGVSGDTVVFSVDSYLNTEESRTATVTFSCGDKTAEMTVTQEAKVYSLSVEPEELVFEAGDNDGKPVLVSSSDGWTLEVSEDWCVPSAVSGNDGDTVTFSVEEFIGTGGEEEKRKATATFTCGDKMAEVLITQGARIYSISVKPEVLNFEAEPSGELAVQVSSSDEWTLEVADDWCTPSVASGHDGDSVFFSVTDWLEAESGRSTTATFSCGNKTAELLISQGARIYSISVEPEELTFEAEPSGELAVQVSSSDEWTLEVADDWCTPSVTSGQDGDSVSFSVTDWLDAEDGRTTTATFSCGNRTAELLITQRAKIYSISVEPKELTFEAEPSGEQAVLVNSSDEWTLEMADDWCTPSVTSGKDRDKVIFNVKEYSDTDSSRRTKAVFSCGNKKTDLFITQNPKKLYSISVTPKELFFYRNIRTLDVLVKSSDDWILDIWDDRWCRPSAYYGKEGETTVTIHIPSYGDFRENLGIFTCGDKNDTIKITDYPYVKPEKIETDKFEISVNYAEQKSSFTITALSDWVLNGFPSWCSAETTSGTAGTHEIILCFETNYTQETRKAEILATCEDKEIIITLIQSFSEDPLIQIESEAFLKDLFDNGVDRNSDGYISEAEAASVHNLTLGEDNSAVSGNYSFEAFTSLNYITLFPGNYYTTFDLSNHPTIEEIYIGGGRYNETYINTIKLDNCKNLKIIQTREGKCHINHLDISNCSSLKDIDFYYSVYDKFITTCDTLIAIGCISLEKLQSSTIHYLDIRESTSLTNLSISGLSYLNIAGCTALKSLSIGGSISRIDLNNDSLESFTYVNGNLTELNLINCTSLKDLYCNGNKLCKLDLSNCHKIQTLICDNNKLSELNLSNCNKLGVLYCGFNELTYLDLQDCPNLNTLFCNDNDLKSIILNINNKDKDYIKSITNEYGDIITFVE